MKRIIGEYTYTVMEKNDFSVCKYKTKEPVTLPDGKVTEDITVKGYALPNMKKITYELCGEFEEYQNKHSKKTQYTFVVSAAKEVIPTQSDAIKAYLVTLKGVGKALAAKMYGVFGKNIFNIIENEPQKLSEINGISKKKAEKIHLDYLNRNQGHELYMYLYRFGISALQSSKIYKALGPDAVSIVKDNPYQILTVKGIGFKTADAIARRENFPKDFEPRIEYGILEVLQQNEKGGELFSKFSPLPAFVLDRFLRPEIFSLIEESETYNTGNVYIHRGACYLMTLKLLDYPLTEARFDEICMNLHRSKRIFIAADKAKSADDVEKYKIYRFHTAMAEYKSAKKIVSLMNSPLQPCEDLLKTIYNVEKKLEIVLSDEQQNAVKMAMENPISIITGGPGTGKTSVQKALIDVFKAYYPDAGILLCAPTGRAAKRMSESTGYPASTLHKALMLYADDDECLQSQEEFLFTEKLIIVDETSMIGAFLLEKLLFHVTAGTRLVFVGDTEQLPSIEVGAVLRELINSKKVPITRLTRTYRQASGSSIITNAARIKAGEKKLEFNSDFKLLADETSETISDTVCSVYPQLIEKYGEDEVMCLTAYRKKTASGANALNVALREVMRQDITAETPYFEVAGGKGMRIYEGDRVMNTKNTEFLTNGDLGKVVSIAKSEQSLIVTCEFDGQKISLEDEEVNSIELAYATTVHKAQGSEAKAVILVTDIAHQIMLKKALLYTGITRARQKIYIVGQPVALSKAISTVDSAYRKSQLGDLIRFYVAERKKAAANQKQKTKPEENEVQLSLL